ncbi:MAG: AAA family ATPase, partial [Acidimicrobiia bacterium]
MRARHRPAGTSAPQRRHDAARPSVEPAARASPATRGGDLLLEEVPDISYADIGGLDTQIEAIADAVELPFLHQELFAEHRLPAPKGILLYGPPGCGKTLIAKAVANSLAKKVAEKIGEGKGRSYFINIKG